MASGEPAMRQQPGEQRSLAVPRDAGDTPVAGTVATTDHGVLLEIANLLATKTPTAACRS